MTSIAFVGGGAMGGSIIHRLLEEGHDPGGLLVVDPSDQVRSDFAAAGLTTSNDIMSAVGARVIVLAVKPQHLAEALAPLEGLDDELVISVVAGVPTRVLEQHLGPVAIVRCMPNTPALIGRGMTALAGGAHATPLHVNQARDILGAVGDVVEVDEADLDAVTAVSGSGPAYVFLLAESMMAAGKDLGLDPSTATRLVEQTLVGAAHLLAESPDGPDALRVRVTSPGGTTQAALEVFDEGDFRGLVHRALAAAARRSRELGDA